jgi:glycosyltransferase involved in cell wall biosynthesis
MTYDKSTYSVSAFIVCMNEESQIRRCLESIEWCNEIVIVDSGSTDSTIAICKEFTDRILFRSWTGYVEQKAYALQQCTSDWVLNIDADEEVSPELKEEMIALLQADKKQSIAYNGFHLSRVVYYLNRWWRHGGWYPEFRLRLCRRSHTTWGGVDPHEKAIVQGATRKLGGELYHYTYSDMQDQITRLNKFSSSAAISIFSHGHRTNIIEILFRPIFRFMKFYIFKQGFRDGASGLIVALIESYYVFLKYAKLWELQRTASNKESVT